MKTLKGLFIVIISLSMSTGFAGDYIDLERISDIYNVDESALRTVSYDELSEEFQEEVGRAIKKYNETGEMHTYRLLSHDHDHMIGVSRATGSNKGDSDRISISDMVISVGGGMSVVFTGLMKGNVYMVVGGVMLMPLLTILLMDK